MEFDHNTQTSYALRGLHQNVPCTGCHVDLVFSKAPTQCSECHADLHRRQFGANCQQCHSVQGWNVQVSAIQDHNNRFPLLGAHAAVICDECHRGAASGVFTGLNTQCVSCHQKDFQTATPLNHVAAGLPTTCEACHGMNSWQQGTRFDHAQFAHFALTGAHASLQCQQCHVGNRYAGTPAACNGCHLNDYMTAKAPDHVAGNFSQDCAGCHTTTTWLNANFDHNTTGFALTGAHNSLQCTQCHNAQFGNYSISSGACWNCHQTDYNNTTNPPHRAGNMPQDCSLCHTTVAGWGGATFNHANTGFALLGAHNTLACTACHNPTFGNYSIASAACLNCHQTDYNGATNPDHKAANFPGNCDGCHNMNNWLGATFNHASTGFTLTGAHTSVQCASCHTAAFGNYNIPNGACANCHMTDYNGTTNPPHQAAGYPVTCDTCHTTVAGWGGATFNHASTGFTLTGAHTSLQCAQCHTAAFGNYNIPNGACANCHMSDYNGAMNPPHLASNFPTTCDSCHTTVAGWGGATFNHATTGFALTGAHTTQVCTACHNATYGNYNLGAAQAACAFCHMQDYNGTTAPNHAQAGFPTTCDSCHTTNLTTPPWAGATFTHPSSPLALTGYHATMLATNQCTACHNAAFFPAGAYSIASGACWNCHQADYNGTTAPAHAAAGFPQDCSACHTFVDWSGATFNHASTGFALTGAHTTQACTACHNATYGNYNLTAAQTACWTCHQAAYNGTTNPPHATAGFPQDCSQCHSTAATTPPWAGATFTHPSTPLALTGYHATMLTNNQCSYCHVGGGAAAYTNTPSDCWSCHQSDYNNLATNPPHKTFPTMFPQTCNSCHTFVDWTGANMTTHDTLTPGPFPIYTGTHAGKWQSCTTCHPSSGDYTPDATLTCMTGSCHPASNIDGVGAHISYANSKGGLAILHLGSSCIMCHPRG
jgi:hypothetical protein